MTESASVAPASDPGQVAVRGGDEAAESRVSSPLRILFAADGSDGADAARRLLMALPLPPGSSVRVVTVLPGEGWPPPPWELNAERKWGEKTAASAAELLARDGVEMSTDVLAGEPAQEIIRSAELFQADLVVLGSRGLTALEEFLIGSVTGNVAKHAEGPVLVARLPQHDLKTVLVVIDDSPHAARVLEFVERLPLPVESEIVVVHIVQGYPPPRAPDNRILQVTYDAAADALAHEIGDRITYPARRALEAGRRRVSTVVRRGNPAAQILAISRERDADLIIAGARGDSLIRRLLVGSVADRLLGSAKCSLLLVH